MKAIIMSDSPKEPPNTNYENQNPGDERPLFRDLLSRAHDLGLADIKTKAISISDPPERRAIFKATVTIRTGRGTPVISVGVFRKSCLNDFGLRCEFILKNRHVGLRSILRRRIFSVDRVGSQQACRD